MRRNQISITLERFGEDAPNGKYQKITVYADSNSLLEALAAANNAITDEIMKTTNIITTCDISVED